MSCLSSCARSVAELELQELLLPENPRLDQLGSEFLWAMKGKHRTVKRILKRHYGLLDQHSLGDWNFLLLIFQERETGQRWHFLIFEGWLCSLAHFFLEAFNSHSRSSDVWLKIILFFPLTNIWILQASNKLVFIKALWAGYSMFSCLFPRKYLCWSWSKAGCHTHVGQDGIASLG